MPSIKYDINSSGAERGAQQFSRAIDRVVADARRAAMAIETMDRAMRGLNQASAAAREAQRLQQQFQAQQRAVQASTTALTGHALALRNVGSASVLAFGPLSGVGSRIIAMGSAAQRTGVLLGGLISGVTGAGVALATSVRNAAQFEAAMIKVGKVTNTTGVELLEQGSGLLKLSSAMGVSAVELATIEENAARLGIRGAQGLAAFAEQIAILTRTTDLGAQQASTQLARFMNLTGTSAGDVAGLSSALVALGNNFAATEGQILEMSLELARGASAFDVGADKILALGASLAAVGERSERSATAMTQVLIGLTQAASGGDGLDKFATVLGVTAERFQELTRQDIGAVFIDLLKVLQTEGPQATAVLDELGIGSARNFKVLLSQSQAIDEVSRALGLVRGEFANATAAQREFELFNDSLVRKLETLGTNLTNVSIALGHPFLDPLKELVDTGTAFLLVIQGVEQPASGVASAMSKLGADVVIAARAFGVLYPLLRVTGELMGELATADLAGFARGLTNIPERLREATSEASKLFADLEKLRTGQPIELFPDATRDAQQLGAAVAVLNGELTQSSSLPRTVADAYTALGQSQERVGYASTAFAEKLQKQAVEQKEAEKAAKSAATETANFAEKIDRTGDALGASVALFARAAAGSLSLAEAEQHAAAASAALSKGQDDAASAAAALAVEQQKATVELLKGTAAQVEANAASEAQAAVLRDAVASGEDYEDAQRRIAVATIDRQAATLAATTGDAAAVEQWRAAQVAALGYADSVERLDAALKAQGTTRDLQFELDLTRQVNAGLLSQLDAKVAIARASAANNHILADELEKQVRIQDEIERQEANYLRLGDTIKDSLGQVFDALIAGTLDFEDAAKSLGLAIGKRWVEGMLESKLRDFDPAVKTNFLDLGEFGKSVFGDLFSDGSVNLPGPTPTGGGGEAVDIFLDEDRLRGLGFSSDQIAELQRGGKTSDVDDVPVGGFRGKSWGQAGFDAAGGAAAGYGTFSALNPLGPGSTGLDGLIAKGAEEGINSSLTNFFGAISTVVGAVLSIWLGPLGGVVSGAVGAVLSGLWADSIDRDTLRTGDFDGFAEFQKWFDPLAFGLTTLFLDLPTLGTAFRRAGEAALDASKTFGGEDGQGGLQALLGDFTRSGEANQRGPEIALERGMSQGQVDTIMGGTGSIFSQMAKDELPEDAGRFAEAMGRTMAEFLSRGLAEGMDYDEMIASLRSFAEESGVTLESSIRNLPNVLAQSAAAAQEFGKLDPFAASQQAADAYAQNVLGISAIFQGDFPAGVNLASIALQTLEKDGVRAFEGLDSEGKATLTNLTQDAALLQDVISHLVEQGFQVDTTDFMNAVADISASAGFIGQNISGAFTGPSVTAGIAAMGEQLKAQVTGAIGAHGLSELFDTTNIGASFEGVFATLRQLQEGAFADQGGVGGDAFRSQIVAAIAEGKATLDEYIPQLRAIRDATEEVNEAIDEALKPTDAEQFWISLEETIKANKDAIDDMAASLFEVAANAEAFAPGSGRDAAREAMDQTIDQSAFNAAKAAAGDFATKSPQGDALAQLTAQFQFKVAAAFQDGVISAEEKLDLARLKGKMDEAGQVLADSISTGTEGLSDLFRADRLKEAIEAAQESLKGSLGGAAGSMFDVISGGGSTAEGIEAFGESFRGSVRDNVLQGMQEALVQSAIMEGALGTLMGQMKQAVSVALSDGFIDADEQAFIDGLAQGIGTATDATLTALGPTLETLGGIAQTVSGNTDQAKDDVKLLNENARETDGVIDEMARRAARNLEDVGDAVPPGVSDAIRAGVGALGDALGDTGSGPAAAIQAGVGALSDAFGGAAGGGAAAISDGIIALSDAFGGTAAGGAPDDIKRGLGALRDAFGPEASADEIGAGLEKIKAALGANGGADGLAAATTAVVDALGGNAGLLGAAATVRDALGALGAAGAAGEAAATMRDALSPAADTVADALRSNLTGGLDAAADAARGLAEAFAAFRLPGAARGGVFGDGAMAVVGERGPEVVNALPGGGFRVTPISFSEMHALLGDGVPGLATGGDLIPISRRPSGRGWGGSPWVGPNDARNPANRERPGGDGADAPELLVSISFDKAIDDFIAGGSPEELSEALRKSAGEGVLEGMKAALIESIAFEEFNAKLSDATREAMGDGVIDAAEAAELSAMAEEFAGTAEQAIAAMGPAFDVVADTFGLRTQEEIVTALTTATATAAELIGGSLRGLLNDPATLNVDAFSQALRGSIYQNVAGGLIDAFVESAVINGALAVPLAAIAGIFDQIGAKQLTVAEANGMIAEQMAAINGVLLDPTFTSSIETLLSGIGDMGRTLDAFPPAARAVESAAVGVSDAVTEAEKDVCRGACGLQEQTIKLGSTMLDGSGRMGDVEDIVWRSVPQFADGGVALRPTFGVFGEAGPEALVPLDRYGLGTYDLADTVRSWMPTGSGAGDGALLDDIRGELAELRRETRNGQREFARTVRELGKSIESRPVHVTAQVGQQKIIDVMREAKRAAKDSGQPL